MQNDIHCKGFEKLLVQLSRPEFVWHSKISTSKNSNFLKKGMKKMLQLDLFAIYQQRDIYIYNFYYDL